MKRFGILVAALLIAGGSVLGQNITSEGDGTAGTDTPPGHGPGNVFAPAQQPVSWYMASTNGALDFSAHGGPTAATTGTSGTFTAGVTPHGKKTAGYGTINGIVTLWFDSAQPDRPGADVEFWYVGSGDKKATCIWFHDPVFDAWVGENPGGPTGQIGISWDEDYYYYDLQLLEDITYEFTGGFDAIAIGGGFADPNCHPDGGPGVTDFDGDGTVDTEIWKYTEGSAYQGRFAAAPWAVGAPEPMTMLLVGGGLLAIIRKR
jgi:hypothetical protein